MCAFATEKKKLTMFGLMSAAAFRRLGKGKQKIGGIQEAKVRDETVWVLVSIGTLFAINC